MLYATLAALVFYVWNHVKFHWYFVVMAGVSMVVKVAWAWRQQKLIDAKAAEQHASQ